MDDGSASSFVRHSNSLKAQVRTSPAQPSPARQEGRVGAAALAAALLHTADPLHRHRAGADADGKCGSRAGRRPVQARGDKAGFYHSSWPEQQTHHLTFVVPSLRPHLVFLMLRRRRRRRLGVVGAAETVCSDSLSGSDSESTAGRGAAATDTRAEKPQPALGFTDRHDAVAKVNGSYQ